jgi:hypothetical protein
VGLLYRDQVSAFPESFRRLIQFYRGDVWARCQGLDLGTAEAAAMLWPTVVGSTLLWRRTCTLSLSLNETMTANLGVPSSLARNLSARDASIFI